MIEPRTIKRKKDFVKTSTLVRMGTWRMTQRLEYSGGVPLGRSGTTGVRDPG